MPEPIKHEADPSLKTGDYENWFVHRAYPTHSEIWRLLQVEGELDGKWAAMYGIQDRDGRWWIMFHDFHNRTASVEKTFEQDLRGERTRDHWYLEL